MSNYDTVVMVPKGEPILKGIVFRYLLAHAEDPSLLKNSTIPSLQKFAKRAPFYDEFVAEVQRNVKGYNESKLLETGAWVPQAEFRAVLNIFKGMSGIQNPFHYADLGTVIPAVGDSLPQLAATLTPVNVIKLSPRFNADFNRDQRIFIEKAERTQNGETRAEAIVQHYMLPTNDVQYLEMVTAALGYWAGIPRLYGWPVLGSTELMDVQMTLEEVLTRDLSFLDWEYGEDSKDVYVNGNKAAKFVSLAENPTSTLRYEPKEEWLTKPLNDFTLVEMINDLHDDSREIVLREGQRFGVPTSRYKISVPDPGRIKRTGYFAKRLGKVLSSLTIRAATLGKVRVFQSPYTFLNKTSKQIAVSDALRAAQLEGEGKYKAELQAADARADVAEAETQIEKQVGRATEVIEASYDDAHHIKNVVKSIMGDSYTRLTEIVHRHPSVQSQLPENSLDFVDVINQTGLEYLLATNGIPQEIVTMAEKIKIDFNRLAEILTHTDSIMGGGSPVEIEQAELSPIVTRVLGLVQPKYKGVEFHSEVPEGYQIMTDKRLFGVALANLVDNAAEHSYQCDNQVPIVRINADKSATWQRVRIYQSGHLEKGIAQRLNLGESFTTKENGHGIGSRTSKRILEKNLGSTIRYFPGEIVSKLRDVAYPDDVGGIIQIQVPK